MKYWIFTGVSLVGPFDSLAVAEQLCDGERQVIEIDHNSTTVTEIPLDGKKRMNWNSPKPKVKAKVKKKVGETAKPAK